VTPQDCTVAELAALLGAPDSALFLDFDGTLVDIAPHPDQVVVEPDMPAALTALQARLGGRLAVVSGRPIAELDRMLAPLVLPAAGVHGMERRAPGVGADAITRLPAPDFTRVRAAAQALADLHPGLWVEEKYGALALHYRQAPQLEEVCRSAIAAAVEGSPELLVMPGKMIVEVKAAGIGKGTAIRDLMAQAPFAGHHPVFAGDDTTDEAGFEYLQSIGGTGVKIGPGPSAARYRIASAADLRAALAQAAAMPTT
jgi:trehalose 6-phosphate phosphatase